MIPFPGGARVGLATGRTDMREGMNGLALQVQEVPKRAPHSGHLSVFRGRRGDLVKVLRHDAQGTREPCSQNLCKGGRVRGYRQRRRTAGAGALDGGVPWKRETPPRRSRLGPSCR